MRRIPFLSTVFALTLAIALGCGGVLDEAISEGVTQQAEEWRAAVQDLPESEERDRVIRSLDRVIAEPGKVGFQGSITVGSKVTEALSDGEISASEAQDIEQTVNQLLGS